ncbi:MAG: hypothetical protein E6R03_15580 [Hyphomicrobiaceae bacterium]|nr:MAG: hypothetical protein E6R03_15580 [Hyphomicrobiaceae bacterium]
MAASPPFKIFNPCGEYVASCKHVEDAAMILAAYGDGAKLRHSGYGRRVLWNEGAEDQPASESYDHVATVVLKRMEG